MPTHAAPTPAPRPAAPARPGLAARSRKAVQRVLKGDERSQMDKAVDAGLRSAFSAATPADQRERLKRLDAALKALQKAAATAPGDPQLPAAAKALQNMAEFALKEQGGGKISARRPSDPALARLFDLHTAAGEVAIRHDAAALRTKHLDAYATAGAAEKDQKGFSRLSPGARSVFRRQGSGVSGRAVDLRFPSLDTSDRLDALLDTNGKRLRYAAAVDHWMHAADAETGKKKLAQLKHADGAAYRQVLLRLTEERSAAHGLHAGETTVISTYSASDYRYINAAASGDSGFLRGMAAEQDPTLLGQAKTPEQVDRQTDRVIDHDLARQEQETEWAAWYQEKYGKQFQAWKSGPRSGSHRKTGFDKALDLAQESSIGTTRREGGLHTGVAVGGLRKLPPWKGKVFRGEGMDDKRFAKLVSGFDQVRAQGDYGKVRPAVSSYRWPHIVSTSRAKSVSEGFLWMPGNEKYKILWELSVLDGRDVGVMSVSDLEMEVLLLPQTEVAIDSLTVTKHGTWKVGDPTTYIQVHIVAHQTRPVGAA